MDPSQETPMDIEPVVWGHSGIASNFSTGTIDNTLSSLPHNRYVEIQQNINIDLARAYELDDESEEEEEDETEGIFISSDSEPEDDDDI